jgi:hypothetical protein
MIRSKIPALVLTLLLLNISSPLQAAELTAAAEAPGARSAEPDPARSIRRQAAIEKARDNKKHLIILKTSCVRYAGTDSRIEARVNKSDGNYSGWVELDNSGNDRERCDEDYYYVTFPAQAGSILHLRTNSRGIGPAWKLLRAEVHSPYTIDTNKSWDIWIGDRKWRGDWCVYEDGVPYNCK